MAQADGLKGQTDGSRQELRRAEMRVSRDEQLETATSGDEEAADDWRRGGPAARTATGSARTGAATGGRPDDERTTAATGRAVRGRSGAGEDGDGTAGRRGDEICDGRPAEAAERRRRSCCRNGRRWKGLLLLLLRRKGKKMDLGLEEMLAPGAD